MATKKKKPTAPHLLISSEEGLVSALNLYVDSRISLLRKKTKQAKELAEMKSLHAEGTRGLDAEILGLETGIQLFCETHRKVLLPDEEKAKSRDFGNAVVGFRLNPHAVEKLVDKDTWERVAERLDALDWAEKFVKTTIEVDKSELLKCRADLTADQLAEAGICFAQGETFFIEPDSALLEAARKPVTESEVAA
jgi:phage host-nuclease inhibitor protein Gam